MEANRELPIFSHVLSVCAFIVSKAPNFEMPIIVALSRDSIVKCSNVGKHGISKRRAQLPSL